MAYNITSPSHMLFGRSSVATSTTTRYLTAGFEAALADTMPVQYRMPYTCKFSNMRVRHNTTSGNGLAIVYTLRVNSVATALSVSLASTSSDGSNTTTIISVVKGDLIDIEVTKAASIAGSPSDIMVSIEISS